MIFAQLRLYLNPLVKVNCGIITVQLGVLQWKFWWFQTCETCARLQNGLYIPHIPQFDICLANMFPKYLLVHSYTDKHFFQGFSRADAPPCSRHISMRFWRWIGHLAKLAKCGAVFWWVNHRENMGSTIKTVIWLGILGITTNILMCFSFLCDYSCNSHR